MFLAMESDGNGGLVGHVPTMADAKLCAYKTAAWAVNHGYGPYFMAFGPDSVSVSCPGLATMTYKAEG